MRIPSTDLDVSPLSLGTGDLGTKVKGDEAFRLLDHYIELGGNFFDTAHIYAAWVSGGAGVSERTLGEWLSSRKIREKVTIATKGGHPSVDFYPHPVEFLGLKSLAKDVEESLERLGVEEIDLYYLHRDDGKTPVAEIIDSLNGLKGLRYFGASNWSTSRVGEANEYAIQTGKRGFVALQNQWSLSAPDWSVTEDPTMRFVTEDDRDWCAAHEVLLHVYSSTAGGFFERTEMGGVPTENSLRRERAQELARKLGRSPTQIALGWLLGQKGNVAPILGTTNFDHLQDAFNAQSLKLDDETLVWLTA